LLALLVLAAWPARAQFIGYTSPQTVQQSLATSLACTGAAQTFAISNLGQTQHYLNVAAVTGTTNFQAEIDGIDRQGNVVRISDVLEPSGAGFPFTSGSLYGGGYFPKIQVVITCSPGTATYTASYSGAWATFNGNAGSYLAGQIDKVTFNAISAGVNQSDTVQTPFGSSAGTLYFKFNTTSLAGTTLQVICSTVTGFGGTILTTGIPALTVTPANTTTGQIFQVPETSCPFAKVSYTTVGGGTTITAEYVFATPGVSQHASSDPCQSGSIPKTSAQIVAPAASTSQQIALALGNSIYVCGYQMSQIATAGTVQWLYGTGANCVTGPQNITGAMGMTASQPASYSGPGYVFKVPMGNALCLTATGAGGAVAGIVTYIQSP
jgi:hypothetical protein